MIAVHKLLSLYFLASLFAITCNTPKQVADDNSSASTNNNSKNTGTSPGTTGITHFGALIVPPNPGARDVINFKEQVAKELNIQYLRDGISLDMPKAHTLLESNFNVVMNINFTGSHMGKRAPFPTDTVAYKRKLSDMIASFPKKPVLIVIENEANNQGFYAGPAKDYINLLRAAIGVVHSYNIPVTDAGTTAAAIKYLLYQHYIQNGMQQQAEAFKRRQKVNSSPNIVASAVFADSVLTALRTLPVDYVNMHWYQNTTDPQDLEAAVNYLKQRTGKVVISNEMGQSDKPDPNVVAAMLKKCKQLQLPYVLWYSGNSTTGARARALHTNAGTLDLNGQAFKKSL